MTEAAISLPTKKFEQVIGIAARALERRNTIPILSMLRCRTNGSFEVTGTDLDVMITAKVDHGGGPGAEFIIPQPLNLAATVSLGGGDKVRLTPADGQLGVSSGSVAIQVKANLPADNFPDLSTSLATEDWSATLSHEQLRSLQRITSAISTEETRYYLNGIHLHGDNGLYRAVATDGHRLCWVDLALPDANGDLPPVIIPRKAVRLMLQLAGKPSPDDAGIALTIGSNSIPNKDASTAPERARSASRARWNLGVEGADVSLTTKLIDGTFPDYRRVIPTANDKAALFKTADLRRAVAAVSIGSGKFRALRMELTIKGAIFSASYADTGIDKSIGIACDHGHPGFSIGFNGSYLMSMLEAARGEEIAITFSDAAGPALITNPADTAWGGVLMPMRV